MSLQAENRGFAEIVAVHLRDGSLVARARALVTPQLRLLIERAQAAGALRPDVVYEDITLLIWTSGRVVEATREVAPDYWRRQLALVARRAARHGRPAAARGRRSRSCSTPSRWSVSPASSVSRHRRPRRRSRPEPVPLRGRWPRPTLLAHAGSTEARLRPMMSR